MAVGLEPRNGSSQETWLRHNAQEITFPKSWSEVPSNKMLIMWVDNPGYMTFTEIIRGESEFDYFTRVLPVETRSYKCFISDKNITIDNADDDLSILKTKTIN